MDLNAAVLSIDAIRGTADPLQLAEIQRTRPVCGVVLSSGERAWLVTGYDEVRRVLNDARFTRVRGGTGGRGRPAARSLQMDGRPHDELRSVISPVFTRRAIRRRRPRIERTADTIAERMARQGPPGDLVKQFAEPFSTAVISEVLGTTVGEREHEALRQWAKSRMARGGDDDGDVQRAGMHLYQHFQQVIAQAGDPGARRGAEDTVLNRLVDACAEKHTLTSDEAIQLAIMIVAAGHETTVIAITRGAWRLFQNPGEFARLRARPELIQRGVEELLRRQFKPNVGIDRHRVATEPVTLGGAHIATGDIVVVSLDTANHDRRVFDDPLTLRVERAPNPHLSFGEGAHYCLGASLARAELQIAFETLLRHFPALAPSAPLETGLEEDLPEGRPRRMLVTW